MRSLSGIFLTLTLLFAGGLKDLKASGDTIVLAPSLVHELEKEGRQELLLRSAARGDSTDTVAIPHSEPKKGVAIALTVLLGPLGGHRLYLGTEPHVPVLYTVTLGGGLGLLPLIDLVHLIIKKDLDAYLDNRKVFMWLKKEKKEEEKEGD